MKLKTAILFSLIFSLTTIAQNNVTITVNKYQDFNFSEFESVNEQNNQGEITIIAAQFKEQLNKETPKGELQETEEKPKNGFVLIIDLDFKNQLEKLPISEEKTLILKHTEIQSIENNEKAINKEENKQQFNVYFRMPFGNESLAMEILTGTLQIKRLNENEISGQFEGIFIYPDAPADVNDTTENIKGEFTLQFDNTLK